MSTQEGLMASAGKSSSFPLQPTSAHLGHVMRSPQIARCTLLTQLVLSRDLSGHHMLLQNHFFTRKKEMSIQKVSPLQLQIIFS